MFAKAAFIEHSFEELSERQTPRIQKWISQDGQTHLHTLLATPDDWLAVVNPIAQQLQEGERYVFFDGHILPAKNGPVNFTGIFRSHNLPELPHLSAALLEETIGNPDYWLQ